MKYFLWVLFYCSFIVIALALGLWALWIAGVQTVAVLRLITAWGGLLASFFLWLPAVAWFGLIPFWLLCASCFGVPFRVGARQRATSVLIALGFAVALQVLVFMNAKFIGWVADRNPEVAESAHVNGSYPPAALSGGTPSAPYDFHASANGAILWRYNRQTGDAAWCMVGQSTWHTVTTAQPANLDLQPLTNSP